MLAKPAGRLMVTAARRGLLGGSRPWLVILVILAGGRVLRRTGGRSGWPLSVSERLEVGIVSKSPPCLRSRWAGEGATQQPEQTLELNELLSVGRPLYRPGPTPEWPSTR